MPNDLRTLVESFATQLEQITRRMALEQVLAAMGGQASTPPRSGKRRGRPPGSKNKVRAAPTGKRGRRSSADLEKLSGSLLAHVKTNPGQRADQIAAAVGTDVGTMRLPMKALIAAKQVRTEGQRRGTTYFAGGGGGGAGKAKTAKRGRRVGKRGAKRKGKARGARAQAEGTLIPVSKVRVRRAPVEAPAKTQPVKVEALLADQAA